mmetsp:Transcript_14907/g.18725  ORF Transcript_14907/g.18725 Transcript_14907/m.18725 type:complete len:87 (+) Transcript_14907:461-721(+)
MAMMQDSQGHLMCQGQYPLPYGCIFNGVLQMESPQYMMAQTVFGLQKNFDDCHIQYQNQMGMVHMLNFMHAITPKLTLGFTLTHTA